ncbi:hypothetical protein [Streptomyces sp. PTY087I2]|uniref:hypothetical protein n=1 Tax=Streptomyces sp. PTY087I2 TaxID=1819298 RepID=UPI00114CF7BA|nr:hypothetical protein [Streptomyces sp. PTY087I2]
MIDERGGQAASEVLERLCAVEWVGEWSDIFGKAMSRRLLMREYLRRAALWAQEYSAESAWPFFDITEYLDSGCELSPSVTRRLEEFLRDRPSEVKTTCRGAVRLAEIRAHNPAAEAHDLPGLYEPLIRFYERGGEFIRDNSGALDLTGVSFRHGSLQGYAYNTPVVALHDAVLDALDAEGRVTFYTSEKDRTAVFRRLLPQGGGQRDEVFSATLGWQTTTQLSTSEDGIECIQIYDQDAARLIEHAVLGGTPRGSVQAVHPRR